MGEYSSKFVGMWNDIEDRWKKKNSVKNKHVSDYGNLKLELAEKDKDEGVYSIVLKIDKFDSAKLKSSQNKLNEHFASKDDYSGSNGVSARDKINNVMGGGLNSKDFECTFSGEKLKDSRFDRRKHTLSITHQKPAWGAGSTYIELMTDSKEKAKSYISEALEIIDEYQ